MKNIHNCDELIKFLVNEFSSYPLDCVEFQGDVLDITMTDYTYEELGFIVDNTLISIASSAEGYFDVKACTTPIKFGESVRSICIQDYVKNELIATLSGEW